MDNQQSYDVWHEDISGKENAIAEPQHPWHVTVARLLPELQGQKVLELGCGRGDFAIWLAQKQPGAEIVAADFSEVAIAIARRRGGNANNLMFRVEDAEHLSFADA